MESNLVSTVNYFLFVACALDAASTTKHYRSGHQKQDT